MAEALCFTTTIPLSLPHFKPASKLPFLFLSSRTTPLFSTLHTSLICCCSSSSSTTTPSPIPKPKPSPTLFSQGTDFDSSRLICPGCGIFMQHSNPDLPGFFQKPTNKPQAHPSQSHHDDVEEVQEVNSIDEGNIYDDDDDDDEFSDDEDIVESDSGDNVSDISDWDDEWDDESEDNEDEKMKMEMDAFALPGVGYGNVTEEYIKRKKKEKISKSERKKRARESKKMEEESCGVTVCARCHSLRNYGQVKNQHCENLIPDFDFDRFISSRLMKPATSAPLVVMVVDCVDFDGSFPRRAAKSLFRMLEGSKSGKLRKLPKLVLVATKVDLLPAQISPTRLDRWVRNRARAAGAPKLSGVYLVSAKKDLGVRNFLAFVKEMAGPRGNVWVIGAQNAGKSTLINSLSKKEGVKVTKLTEAAVPGTTLGILRIAGILPAKAKMYDTPGLLHPYLMTMRLSREEQKMVEIRKELQPRTYRMKVGQTVHVGGLMRLDLTESSVETIYASVWASPNISLHMGKTENADEIRMKHVGIRLQPPIVQEHSDRLSELGEWKPKEIKISGISWDVNSLDISVSGLGWFSLGLKGEATVMLWTFDGVEVTKREALVLDRAPFIERPGFLLPQAISDAIGKQGKAEAKEVKLREERMLAF